MEKQKNSREEVLKKIDIIDDIVLNVLGMKNGIDLSKRSYRGVEIKHNRFTGDVSEIDGMEVVYSTIPSDKKIIKRIGDIETAYSPLSGYTSWGERRIYKDGLKRAYFDNYS